MDLFKARLMNLSEQELVWLRSDEELSSILEGAQHMIESRLQQIMTNASSQISERQQIDFSYQTSNNNNNYSANSHSQYSGSVNPLDASYNRFNLNHALDLRVQPALAVDKSNNPNGANHIKRPKGEFDEPDVAEIELRMEKLVRQENNYHLESVSRGICPCVLGSEFKDKSASSVLDMIEAWRLLPLEQRLAYKWDTNDLPKDIPLCDINRFESLRRAASSGRANFGGVSKRKPLGIRGTRQFLLILYCVWGHPGRDDPMQRDGYCPHCFAKIKKLNEQSILVRVVNHFNMKHKRGANPRNTTRVA